jgi:hypothetical protein
MAKVIGDVCFPNGSYIKDGEEKTRWMNCGILLETEKGMRIKLEAIPANVGENGMWFSVFEKDNKPRATSTPPATERSSPEGEQDNIPF